MPRQRDLPKFCINWLKNLQEKTKNDEITSESETEDVSELETKIQKKFEAKKGRSAVSAEVYGDYNKKEEFKPRVIPKSEDVKTRILTRLKQSFIFRNLDDKETNIVIDAME